MKKLAVKLNAPLSVSSAHLVLIYSFYIELIERLEGVSEGQLGDWHWYVIDMNK